MKSTVEPLEGNQVRLTVTIPADRVDAAIAHAYSETAGKVRVPGFRKGKAPRKVIDTYVGREQVLSTALEEVVEAAYSEALDETRLRPVDRPDVGELDALTEGAEYTFSAEVTVRPQLTLEGDWEHLKVEILPMEVSPVEVDAQVEHLRERHASLGPVEDRGVEKGDFVLLSFVGTVGGEAYEGNTVDHYLYEVGAGQMPDEFEDGLLGAKPGEERSISFDIPETSSREDFVGKTATFEVSVHEIKAKQLPELDDAFAAEAGGFDSLDELREDIKKRIEDNRKLSRDREVERLARIELAEHAVGDIPEVMFTERRDQMVREFFSNLEQQGITLTDYVRATDIDPTQIQEDIEREARARVKQELAMEALFRAQGWEVTDADVEQFVGTMTGGEKTPAQLREEWERAGMWSVLRESVMHERAAKWLQEHAEVVEKAPEAPAEAEGDKPKKPKKAAKKKEE